MLKQKVTKKKTVIFHSVHHIFQCDINSQFVNSWENATSVMTSRDKSLIDYLNKGVEQTFN